MPAAKKAAKRKKTTKKALAKVERCVKCGKVLLKEDATAPAALPRCTCQQIAEKRVTHGTQIVKARCELCKSIELVLIEDEYVNWEIDAKEIATRYGFSYREDVLPHLHGRGLIRRRAINNVPLYLKAEEMGMDALSAGLVTPDTAAKLGLQAAMHIDKVEGRITQRIGIDTQLTLVAPPLPGGPPGSEKDEDIIDGEWEELLGEETLTTGSSK